MKNLLTWQAQKQKFKKKMKNNSELLKKTLIILKNKKSGKKIIKDFTRFLINFEEIKESFHLTFPEISSNLSEHERNNNQTHSRRT